MRNVYPPLTDPVTALTEPLTRTADDQPEPDDPASLLAAYFRTPRYRREVKRQLASHATLVEVRQELADYWREGSYGHAQNLADS